MGGDRHRVKASPYQPHRGAAGGAPSGWRSAPPARRRESGFIRGGRGNTGRLGRSTEVRLAPTMRPVSRHTCPEGRAVCPHGEWLGLLVVPDGVRPG